MATSPVAVARADGLLAPRSSPTVGRALWRFVRKKPLGAAGAVIMAVIVVTAAFADLVAKHDPVIAYAGRTFARPMLSVPSQCMEFGRAIERPA